MLIKMCHNFNAGFTPPALSLTYEDDSGYETGASNDSTDSISEDEILDFMKVMDMLVEMERNPDSSIFELYGYLRLTEPNFSEFLDDRYMCRLFFDYTENEIIRAEIADYWNWPMM